MNVNTAVREEQAMRQITDRLTRTFTPDHTVQEVTRTIAAVRHRFDGQPVRDYVPVLVERYSRQELATPHSPTG